MIKDKFSKARGGRSRIVVISCAKCQSPLIRYQKDGPGELRRLYIDRILSEMPGNKLTCPNCKRLLGVTGVYNTEGRDCIFLFQGVVTKSIIKENDNYQLIPLIFKKNSKYKSQEYIDFSIWYYLAARSAHSMSLAPINGNLFHHAIEMLLKGTLKQHFNEDQLWGHRLTKLWHYFIQKYKLKPKPMLSNSIKQLDKLEKIRYPYDEPHTMSSRKNMNDSPELPKRLKIFLDSHPHFIIELDSIDELYKYIWESADLAEELLSNRLNRSSRMKVYLKENDFSIL
jgi:hypothetical protein